MHPPGPQVQVRDVPASTHGCSAPLQLIPIPSYLGDAAVPPLPGTWGSSRRRTARPSAEEEEEKNRVCCCLPPGKHGQVGGATAGGQEPGDEWEPGPAPSGSRENAAPAKARAGFAATTRFPWGKASRGRWETGPLWIKSLSQCWRKVDGQQNVLAARMLARRQLTAARCTKKSLFLRKNFKLARYPRGPGPLSQQRHC